MICPKCGNEIAEGHLYCEVCGEEIQMVPDFDIQVEESINVSLSTVAGDVNKPVIDEETINSYTTKELPVDKINDSLHGETNTSDYLKNILKKIPTAWLVLGAAIFVVIIMSLFIALRSFSEPSVPENTYAKARKLYDAGDYTRTIETSTKHYVFAGGLVGQSVYWSGMTRVNDGLSIVNSRTSGEINVSKGANASEL